MITPGRAWYLVHSRFRHGLRTFYYRDLVRPRILSTAPVKQTVSDVCEIHVLTSESDLLNMLWALKSFYRISGSTFKLCIHDDGSLQRASRELLSNHFPNARLILRSDADLVMNEALQSYPLCKQLRASHCLALKLFDFLHYLESDRLLLIDSDILFFRHPTELLRRIEDPTYLCNTVNGDVKDSYTVTADAVREQCGFFLQSRFNSGLGLIHRKSVTFADVERYLSLPNITSHPWLIEQTLFALCSSQHGVQLLPQDYDVSLATPLEARPCRHYVGAIRHLLYDEGIRKLVQTGFLRQN